MTIELRQGEAFQLGLLHPKGSNLVDSHTQSNSIVVSFVETPVTYQVSHNLKDWRFKLTSGNLLLVPQDCHLQRRTPATDFRELTISFNEELENLIAAEFCLDKTKIRQSFSSPHTVRTTTWIYELTHRLLFEAYTCDRAQSLASRFCVWELVKELYYLRAGQLERQVDRTSQISDPLVARAMQQIEEQLSEDLALTDLCQNLHCSIATLQRRFKAALQESPMAYRRRRRLEVSYHLLESGRHSVSDAALAVGYEDVSSFTAAFKKEFQILPHSLRMNKTLG